MEINFQMNDLFIDHEIATRNGSTILICNKHNVELSSAAYVYNKTCLYCGKLQPLNNGHTVLESNPIEIEDESPEINRSAGDIICERCSQTMEQTSPGTFFCINGHKKVLVSILETEIKDKPKKEIEEKKKRTVSILCPQCKKPALVEKENKVPGVGLIRKYSCGHTVIDDLLAPPLDRDAKWNCFYEFQQKGIEFAENANYSALIADEMGLGKTIQALGILRYNYSELTPTLIVCEASKVYDWQDEFLEWVGDKYNGVDDFPIIHKKGKFGLIPDFKIHIISMSLLQKHEVLESIKAYGFKFMIVDESHSFKNENADRTYALQQIANHIPNRIFLSGTPVLNNVTEYFVTLNLIRPSHFPSRDYLTKRCDRSSTGRILGISNWYRPRFFAQTNEYVIRRTKKDAGIKLPNFRKNTKRVAVDYDKNFVKKYNALLDELEQISGGLKEGAARNAAMGELMGVLAKLRHSVGVMKVMAITEMVEEFLESTDPEDKITIGVHHHLVMEMLQKTLKEYNPICISDEAPEIKAARIEKFKKMENRVLIASILGAGQGLNIQFCKNAIIAEREWNPSKEEQFMGRFHRIVKNPDGSVKTEFDDARDSVNVDILNAKDTIDEFFDELNSLKDHIVGSTMESEFSYDLDFLLELCRKITSARMKYAGS